MVLDFTALKDAVADYIERYDHAMAMNSNDSLLPAIKKVHPESVIVFEDTDPTTEVIAKDVFDHLQRCRWGSGIVVERVKVWETPTSWAEYGA